MEGRANHPGLILRGILLLARGRVAGFACFEPSARGFLASLAPLLALPIAKALLSHSLPGLTDLLQAICAVLTAPVLSHALAKGFARETLWLGYATATNWCQWAMPVAALLLLPTLGVAVVLGGGTANQAAYAVACLLVAYGLWLHWFLARHGLALDGLRAAFMVAGVNLGVLVVAGGPELAAMLLGSGA